LALPQDWQQYQEDAAAFFRSLGFAAEVNHAIKGVRSNHQIDVYVAFEKWGMRHTWIVECKKHARPVTKADVETLKTIVSEVGASLGFLLSESGFQSGAIDAASKTNIILSSLTNLRTQSRDDVLRETLRSLENKALELQKLMRSFMITVERGQGYRRFKIRDGVDSKLYFPMAGSIAMLKMELDRVRLGEFPVILPGNVDIDQNSYIRVMNLEEFVTEAEKILTRTESWTARQNPK
jgi:hypothetical protein